MLEWAKETTRCGRYTFIEYARFANDIVILVDGYRKWKWLVEAVYQRLLEEFAKFDVQINTEKTRQIDLTGDESFAFLGFDVRRVKSLQDRWRAHITP